MTNGTVVVIGAGALDGIGGALAHRFAKEGNRVLVTGKTAAKVEQVAETLSQEGLAVQAMKVDVTSEADQDALFSRIADDGDELKAVLFNAGNNAVIPFEQVTSKQFEDFWRIGCFGAFLTAKRALPLLEKQGSGSLFFTGASGSLRGKPSFAHFASMKAGLRMLAQSLAREYGPRGVHVAHIVIDGIVAGQRAKTHLAQYVDALGEDGTLSPTAIADTFWHLHTQPRSAWTHELELRPFKENW
ncbi:MAG: SDR family NAD(P)-dependent oxidoreductase [Pseudomonadota bacterium]